MYAITWILIVFISKLIVHSHAGEAHLLFIRHIESIWNANRVYAKDSPVSALGKEQLKNMFVGSGQAILSNAAIKNLFKNGRFHLEASNLRRAQLSLIAAWESTINYAAAQSSDADMATIKGTLEEAKYIINEALQEKGGFLGIRGIDAWTKFPATKYKNRETGSCLRYFTYLEEGYTYEGNTMQDLWDSMFTAPFKTMICNDIEYKPKPWGGSYGKYLHDLITKGKELIFIGGHSHYFMYFIDKWGDANIKAKWGTHQTTQNEYTTDDGKVKNGCIVDVVIEQSTPTAGKYKGKNRIKINSVNGIYLNAPYVAPVPAPAKEEYDDYYMDLIDYEFHAAIEKAKEEKAQRLLRMKKRQLIRAKEQMYPNYNRLNQYIYN